MKTQQKDILKNANLTLPLCIGQQHYEPFMWELIADDGDGDTIGTIFGSSLDDKENLAESEYRAAYIVKCVNSHEQLVEALNDLLSTSSTLYEHTQEHCKSSVKMDYLTYKVKAERILKLVGGGI